MMERAGILPELRKERQKMFISLQGVVQKHGPLILGVILAVSVGMGLLFTPTGSMFGRKQGRDENLPTIQGKRVNPGDFQKAKNIVMTDVVSRSGQRPPRTLEFEDQINIQAVQRLILMRKAQEFGITANDDDVDREVGSQPTFLTEQRQFDRDRYLRYINLLNNLDISEEQFRESVRQQIIMARLRALITTPVKVAPAELKLAYTPLHEETAIDYVEVNAADQKQNFDIKDDEAKAFYDLNKEKFRKPAEVKVREVYFTISDARKSVTLGEDEIREYYELNKGKYLDDQKKPKPLAEVKDEVKKDLLDLRAERLAGDRATGFSVKLVHEPGTARPDFAKIAADFGLTPHETDFFSLRGAVAGVNAGPQFNQAAFSLSPEVPFSDPVRGEDGYYVLEYLASQPSEVPPFEQVKERVVELLKQQRARDAAVKQGRELAAKVKEAVAAGKNFKDACASLGLKAKTPEPFSIAQETTNIPFASRIKDMALGMPTNAVSEFILTADGGLFFHLKQRTLPSPEDFEKNKAQMALQLLDRNRQALFEDWANTVLRDERIQYTRKAHPKQQEAPAEDDTKPADQSAPAKS
jgi:peptidyl-prolyl cis-trans isomerase D